MFQIEVRPDHHCIKYFILLYWWFNVIKYDHAEQTFVSKVISQNDLPQTTDIQTYRFSDLN